MAKKLNSMRLLEQNDIPYEAIEYSTHTRDAAEIAEMLGVPTHMVFKTLIIQPTKGDKPLVAMIAADRNLDLKKMAAAAGEKKVRMAAHKDAEDWTGLQVGGISPLALMHKNWTVYIDQSAADLEHILLSAGQRGTQLRVPTAALIRLVGAQLADISD